MLVVRDTVQWRPALQVAGIDDDQRGVQQALANVMLSRQGGPVQRRHPVIVPRADVNSGNTEQELKEEPMGQLRQRVPMGQLGRQVQGCE